VNAQGVRFQAGPTFFLQVRKAASLQAVKDTAPRAVGQI